MVILALIVGLSVGALGVYAVVRPALVDRRRRAVVSARRPRSSTTSSARLETAEAGAGERMVSAFKEMSAEALRENSAAFTRQAIGEFDQYVKPLKESLDKVEKSSQTLEERRQRDNGELHKELDHLVRAAATVDEGGPHHGVDAECSDREADDEGEDDHRVDER